MNPVPTSMRTEQQFMTANAKACHADDGSTALTRLPWLADPELKFNLLQELQQLRLKDSWGLETGRSSKTLAKHPDFRIVLVLMKAATQMNQRRAEGRVSIHQLLGRICVSLPDRKINLSAGELLVLDCGVLHNLEALEESAFLLTISWQNGRGRARDSEEGSAERIIDEEALLRMNDEGGPQ
jgi:quercetin dioxygenase-like cupin family protein